MVAENDFTRAAQLAIHHYGALLDPNHHHIPYFFVKLARDESYAWHSGWDCCDATGRYLDAAISCRLISGDESGRETEEKLKDAVRWSFTPGDGLSYRMETNDWVTFGANMFDQRSILLGLLSWYLEKGEKEPEGLIQGMVRALWRTGVHRDDYVCFPWTMYGPDVKIPDRIFDEHGFIVDPVHYGGVIILPLSIYYEQTRDKETRELLDKMVRFIVGHARVYGEDGSFWSRSRYQDDGHFHSRMGTVAGVIRYAIATDNEELLRWADRVYRWAFAVGSSTGWFPEMVGLGPNRAVDPQYRHSAGPTGHSETCCTTDMIHCALWFSRCGFADYWDQAEAYQSHLLASQIVGVPWAKNVTDKPDTDSRTYRDVPARYVGAFAGRTRPNDLTLDGEFSTMACCCGAGGRGLRLLWDNAVLEKDGKHIVNLYLSRETPELTVRSFVPREGKLELAARKELAHVLIRIPGWMDGHSARLEINGAPVSCVLQGHHLELPALSKGDSVAMTFALIERKSIESVGGTTYTMSWKGNRVVGIDPPGTYVPLYRGIS